MSLLSSEWDFSGETIEEEPEYYCINCGWVGVRANLYNFCPDCGAAMNEEALKILASRDSEYEALEQNKGDEDNG